MALEFQTISLKSVWRGGTSQFTFEEAPIGQVFAFFTGVVMESARAAQMPIHEYLLRATIQGLWEWHPKKPILAGYFPIAEQLPTRIFLMSAKAITADPFHGVVSKLPGYMECGQTYVEGDLKCLLAWWEYPCTMVALWPEEGHDEEPIDGDYPLRVPHQEQQSFVASGRTYRYSNRVFRMQE